MENKAMGVSGHVGRVRLWCFLLLLYTQPFTFTSMAEANLSHVQEFAKFIEHGQHDFRVPPEVEASDSRLHVDLALWINAITDIDEINMDFTMNLYFEQIWKDRRLIYLDYNKLNDTESISVPHTLIPTLWLPDAYFENAKEETRHVITVPNNYMRVYPNGTVRYDQRLTLKVWCIVYLERYPHDRQSCTLNISSYRYTTQELLYRWRAVAPVEFGSNILMSRYKLVDFALGDCTLVFGIGNYSCVSVTFHLSRQVGYYMLQIYVPTVLIVLLSWVSFYLDPLAVPGRISLGILTVLTMATQAAQLASELPKVSYIKAVDVWMTSLMIFLVAALLEFAIVNSLARREISHGTAATEQLKKYFVSTILPNGNKECGNCSSISPEGISNIMMTGSIRFPNGSSNVRKRPTTTTTTTTTTTATTSTLESTLDSSALPPLTPGGLVANSPKTLSRRLDVISRIAFPAAFILFNCFYWGIYLTESISGH